MTDAGVVAPGPAIVGPASAAGRAAPTALVSKGRAGTEAAVGRVCQRIAPLWPLKHFVAVNPFLGLSDEPFVAACARMERVAGAAMLMPRAYFRARVAEGHITDADLAAALAEADPATGAPASLGALKQALAADPLPRPPLAATVAEVIDRTKGARLAPLATEEVAKWCAAYWDEGQAAWHMPWRGLPLYPAWRAAARHDRTPEAMGLAGFRRALGSLPDNPLALIATILDCLELPEGATEPYLHRALASVGGWAAYARYRAWTKELAGETDDTLVHLLAIRLAWDGALFATHRDAAVRAAWRDAVAVMEDVRRQML